MNVLQLWMRLSTPEEQADLASRAGTTRPYLYQLAAPGVAREAGPDLAARLERAAAEIRATSPRGDKLPVLLRTDLTAVCRDCDFARQCLGNAAVQSAFTPVADHYGASGADDGGGQ